MKYCKRLLTSVFKKTKARQPTARMSPLMNQDFAFLIGIMQTAAMPKSMEMPYRHGATLSNSLAVV